MFIVTGSAIICDYKPQNVEIIHLNKIASSPIDMFYISKVEHHTTLFVFLSIYIFQIESFIFQLAFIPCWL